MNKIYYDLQLLTYANTVKRLEGMKRGDGQTRVLRVKLIDRNGLQYQIEGATALIRIAKPDGKICLLDGALKAGNLIECSLSAQSLAVEGTVYGEIALFDQSGAFSLSSQIFAFDVTGVPGVETIESSNEFGSLAQVIAQSITARAQLSETLAEAASITEEAGSAVSVATQAASQAANAVRVANQATASATAATSQATKAAQDANTAKTAANNAAASANQGAQSANAAAQAASSAKNAASAATSQATVATSNANSAAQRADAAASGLNTLKQEAQEATAEAKTETQKATKAAGDANTAKNAANTAASQASQAAQAATQAANNANATVSGALASSASNGLMSSADKVKLSGIAVGANKYVHPSTHAMSQISGLQAEFAKHPLKTQKVSDTSGLHGLRVVSEQLEVQLQNGTWKRTGKDIEITSTEGTSTTKAASQALVSNSRKTWQSTDGQGFALWVGTQSAYDALQSKNANTLYFTKEG